MAGIANDYLIFPIMDLIQNEVRKYDNNTMEGNPFEGTPSVRLFREHPLDDERVTGARLFYESGYMITYQLSFGTDDVTTIPVEVVPGHPEWDYYANYRLTQVSSIALAPDGTPLVTYLISLNYDNRGALTGTDVTRI